MLKKNITYIVGAGLAEPDAVFRVRAPAPFGRDVAGVTDNLDGLGLVPVPPDDALRCGMRDGVASSKILLA